MSEKSINGFLAVFFTVLVTGFAFHQSETFAGSLPGHLIGIAGMVMLFLTLVYPFKKRVLRIRGRKNPLSRHIFYGLVGPSLVVIHSAHKLESVIGLLTFLTMVVVVLSGIAGRFLFKRASRTLKERERELAALRELFGKQRKEAAACAVYFGLEKTGGESGKPAENMELLEEKQRRRCDELVDLAHSISELEYSTAVFDSTRTLFSRWMRVHHVLTLFLFSFAIVHILTVLYYGLRWVP
jgi:hypothetical protein